MGYTVHITGQSAGYRAELKAENNKTFSASGASVLEALQSLIFEVETFNSRYRYIPTPDLTPNAVKRIEAGQLLAKRI